MRLLKAPLQYFEDLDAEIFRGGHSLGEFFQRIQILEVVAREHFLFDETVEIDQIADHSGAGVEGAADADLEGVVVAVSVRVVAFAVGSMVFVGGHFRAMQAVRGGEAIAAREMGFHGRLLALGFWLLAVVATLARSFAPPEKRLRSG